MGEKDHRKADTFVTLKCCRNLVSENNTFNVFCDSSLLIIVFTSQGTLWKLYKSESTQERKNSIKSTQELKVENNLLYEEQQKGYHKCLQDGSTF